MYGRDGVKGERSNKGHPIWSVQFLAVNGIASFYSQSFMVVVGEVMIHFLTANTDNHKGLSLRGS